MAHLRQPDPGPARLITGEDLVVAPGARRRRPRARRALGLARPELDELDDVVGPSAAQAPEAFEARVAR